MAEKGYIAVDGWREFRRAVRRSTDQRLPKRLGQANKRTGQFIKELVEREARPEAVGRGRGSEVRPSAAQREVIWRVGGAHRANPSIPPPTMSSNRFALAQWGKDVVRPFRRAPKRPYMKQIADRHRDEIGDFFLQAVSEAMDPAFHDTEP